MKISKNIFSPISIDKHPLSNKSSQRIIIPKIMLNDPFKNKIKQNYLNNVKLPSIKCVSTKNSSKYDNINDFQDLSIIKNSTIHNKIINSKKKFFYKGNMQDNFYKNKSKSLIKNANNIYDYNYKNISQDSIKNNGNISLKKSSSAIFSGNTNKLLSKYKIKNILNFHKDLMENNKISYDKSLRSNYLQMKKEENIKNDNYIKSILEEKNKRKIKTGIFGPSNNIVSIIRAKMERLKYDNIYKGVEEDIKELIKDEIMDAQVKLKREPQNLIVNKNGIIPYYIKKMDQYRYLSKMNKIIELNQRSSIPVLEQDKNIMLRLFNDSFDILRNEKRKNN